MNENYLTLCDCCNCENEGIYWYNGINICSEHDNLMKFIYDNDICNENLAHFMIINYINANINYSYDNNINKDLWNTLISNGEVYSYNLKTKNINWEVYIEFKDKNNIEIYFTTKNYNIISNNILELFDKYDNTEYDIFIGCILYNIDELDDENYLFNLIWNLYQ